MTTNHFFNFLNKYNLDSNIINIICKDYTEPTKIQFESLPHSLNNDDLIGIAPTGSGKTLAFTIPSLSIALKNIKQKNTGSPNVLVISPTRELTIQTFQFINKYSSNLNLKSVCIYGEGNEHEERKNLSETVNLLIATSGKIIKYLKDDIISLSDVSLLVLDEADKLIDLGFSESLDTIIKLIPKNHQTLLFSATWPQYIQEFSKKYIKESAKSITIVNDNSSKIPTNITQTIEIINKQNKKREKRIIELLNEFNPSNNNLILIFVLYKSEASELCDYIEKNSNFKCGYIEGDMKQKHRTDAIEKFKSGEVPILVATDVVSRGIDIDNISHVINFSFGLSTEHYIHRIGRCGRNNKNGNSYTFFVDYDYKYASDLINILETSKQNVPEELREIKKEYKFKENNNKKNQGDSYFLNKKNNATKKNEEEIFDSDDDEFFGDSCKIIENKPKKTHSIHSKNQNQNQNHKNKHRKF
jgi:ATP-dependent RNA helicase DBP3